jgi:hypothetical protein
VDEIAVNEALGEEGLLEHCSRVGCCGVDEGVSDVVDGSPVDPRHEHILLS